ncbi:NAPDH-dependent diflavin reductase [Elasticomyces elasticus]|nr:NAPDH-dependent diflavin reductase [Elasticomyces elasticus]
MVSNRSLSTAEFRELGRSSYGQKDYVKALDYFNEAINASQEADAVLLDNRAATHAKLGNLENALKDARKAINAQRREATGYLRAGNVLQQMKRPVVALSVYKYGLRTISPTDQNMHLLQAMHDKLSCLLSPPSAVDPFSVLPIELVEIVLSHLHFQQIVNCIRVSKEWKLLIHALPKIWSELDLSKANKKPVKNAFVSACVTRSKGQLKRAVLQRLQDPDKSLWTIVKPCHQLRSLELRDGNPPGSWFLKCSSMAKSLSEMKLYPVTDLNTVTRVLALCPVLRTFEALAVCSGPSPALWLVDLPALRQIRLVATIKDRHSFQELGVQMLVEKAPSLRSLSMIGWGMRSSAPFIQRLDLSLLELLETLDFTGSYHVNIPLLPQSIRCLHLKTGGDPLSNGILEQLWDTYLPKLEEVDLRGAAGEQTIFLLHALFHFVRRPDGGLIHRPATGLEKETSVKKAVFSASFAPPGVSLDMMHYVGTVLSLPRLQVVEHLEFVEADVSDAGLIRLAEIAKTLRRVDISGTRVTGVGIKAFILALKDTLEWIAVNNCANLSSDAVDWAREQGVIVEYRMSEPLTAERKVRY